MTVNLNLTFIRTNVLRVELSLDYQSVIALDVSFVAFCVEKLTNTRFLAVVVVFLHCLYAQS